MKYSIKPLGISKETQFGELEIGKKYLVMGLIMTCGYLSYLVDDRGLISACPSPLFEIIDHIIPPNWFFKSYNKDFYNYENIEAIFGYYELVFDDNHFEKLIDMDKDAHFVYFKRKIDLQKMQSESDGAF